MRDIVLVTDSNPGRDEAQRELQPLLAAFTAGGVRARHAAWDDPAERWTSPAVLRTPWDYHRRLPEFLRWATGVPLLFNPFTVVEWNARKTYLRELDERGVPVVPTEWLEGEVSLAEVMQRRGWAEAVLKPQVSAGSFRTRRFGAAEASAAQQLLTEILATSGAMLQPYLPSVESSGERSLVYFGGRLSHAVKRHPPLSTGLHGGALTQAHADELALAERALAAAPGPLLYARVDLARDAEGHPRLMELELIEPSFFLELEPAAAARFVAAAVESAFRPQGQ